MGTDMQMETQKGPTLQESGNHKSYFEHMYFFFHKWNCTLCFALCITFTDVIIFFMLIIDIDHNFYAT